MQPHSCDFISWRSLASLKKRCFSSDLEDGRSFLTTTFSDVAKCPLALLKEASKTDPNVPLSISLISDSSDHENVSRPAVILWYRSSVLTFGKEGSLNDILLAWIHKSDGFMYKIYESRGGTSDFWLSFQLIITHAYTCMHAWKN